MTLHPASSPQIWQYKISKIDFCMILWSKVGFLLFFITKIVANQYCTDTSVWHSREKVARALRLCVVLGNQGDVCVRYGDFK